MGAVEAWRETKFLGQNNVCQKSFIVSSFVFCDFRDNFAREPKRGVQGEKKVHNGCDAILNKPRKS